MANSKKDAPKKAEKKVVVKAKKKAATKKPSAKNAAVAEAMQAELSAIARISNSLLRKRKTRELNQKYSQ